MISAHAPGRVELLGNHTDYNQGLVLAAAIDRELTVSGAARSDDIVSFTSETHIEVSLGEIRPQTIERWANYPLGVVRQFQERGFAVRGFDARITGDLAAGVGLSSSAALEVATAGFLMKLHHLQIAPFEIAKLCQRAENEFVGVPSGPLDQVTSVFGRADHLVYLDCQSDEIRTIPFPPGFALVIADSGVKHSLVQGEYKARREECAAAARAMGAASLREITPQHLGEVRASLDPLHYRRALHIVGENDRVCRAVAALETGDAHMLGQLMNASHESSRLNFENSTPELDLLVAIAQSLTGVLGARLTGGGFGGGTVSLVRREAAESVVSALQTVSQERGGRVPAVFVCRIADGAAVGWES